MILQKKYEQKNGSSMWGFLMRFSFPHIILCHSTHNNISGKMGRHKALASTVPIFPPCSVTLHLDITEFFSSLSKAGYFGCHILHHTQQFWTECKIYLCAFFFAFYKSCYNLSNTSISFVSLCHKLNSYQP